MKQLIYSNKAFAKQIFFIRSAVFIFKDEIDAILFIVQKALLHSIKNTEKKVAKRFKLMRCQRENNTPLRQWTPKIMERDIKF